MERKLRGPPFFSVLRPLFYLRRQCLGVNVYNNKYFVEEKFEVLIDFSFLRSIVLSNDCKYDLVPTRPILSPCSGRWRGSIFLCYCTLLYARNKICIASRARVRSSRAAAHIAQVASLRAAVGRPDLSASTSIVEVRSPLLNTRTGACALGAVLYHARLFRS